MASSRQRSAAIDLIRVIAIVAVVLRHTYYDPDGVVAQIVCPWAIAIFFVLTGYLWSDRKTLQQDVDSRATGLLVPYVAWMITISIPYFIWWFATEGSGALYFLVAYAYGPQLAVFPYSACWFFTVMFFAVVILRYLTRHPRWITWAVIAATLAVTVVAPKTLWYFPLGIGLAFPCLLFIVFGQELRRFRPRIRLPFLTGTLLAAIGGVAVWQGASHDSAGELLEIKLSMYGYPVAGLVSGAVIAVGIVLIADSVERFIPRRIAPAITEFAGAATFSMFLHPVLLLWMHTPETGRFPDFVVALVVPIALGIACQRLGILRWWTGDHAGPPIPFTERIGALLPGRRASVDRAA